MSRSLSAARISRSVEVARAFFAFIASLRESLNRWRSMVTSDDEGGTLAKIPLLVKPAATHKSLKIQVNFSAFSLTGERLLRKRCF